MYGFAEMKPPTAGLNSGFKIKEFFEIKEGNYGTQVYFEFDRAGENVRQWYSAREDNERSIRAFSVTMTQFLTGFYPPEEHASLKAKVGGNHASMEAFIAALKAALPQDYKEREVTLALTVNGDGWVELPKAAFVNDGHIFWAHPDFEPVHTDRFDVEIAKAKEKRKETGNVQTSTGSGGASW